MSSYPVPVQSQADGADASIHHVGGGYHVGARIRVHDSHSRELLEGRIIVYTPIDHQSVVPVGRVCVERDVRDQDHPGAGGLDGADGLGIEAVRIERFTGGAVLGRISERREERNGTDSERLQFLDFA